MTSKTLLALDSINKSFKSYSGEKLIALKNISFSLQEEECIGIVGESGCGKSTLARIICRLTPIDYGYIYYKGQDLSTLAGKEVREYYRRVQMIFQDPLATFSPRMRIGEYLIEPFINFKLMNKTQAKEHSRVVLQQVGLSADLLNRYPAHLLC
jgi:ABC-type oligopeptide transport system ATPase subunit